MIVYNSIAYFKLLKNDCLQFNGILFDRLFVYVSFNIFEIQYIAIVSTLLYTYLLTGGPLLARISPNASFSRSQNARYAGTHCTYLRKRNLPILESNEASIKNY